jgi:hypothetical protein
MQRSRPTTWLVPLLSALLFGLGCSDPHDGRVAVSGTVTFHGQPLDQGIIMFMPASGDLPTQASVLITNGQYHIPAAQGLRPGRYKVSISSGDGRTPAVPSDAPPGPSGNFSSQQRIPEAFNVKSTLEAEVKKGGPNRFDYPIP